MDESIAVRESVVDLVGKSALDNPKLVDFGASMLMLRVKVSGILKKLTFSGYWN